MRRTHGFARTSGETYWLLDVIALSQKVATVRENFYASTPFVEAAKAAGITGMLFAEHPET